ncbi:MAG: hypothetical protein V1928_01685 [Parcubacteria group bacterium]
MKNENETSTSIATATVFDSATMAFTVKQLIELNNGTNLPLMDGSTILDASFVNLRDIQNPKIVELVTLKVEETYCVKIPDGYAASGATLLLSYEGANTLLKKFGILNPVPMTLAKVLRKRAEEDAADQEWKDVLAPMIGKYDDSRPFQPWASKKDILAKDIADILPFNGTIPSDELERFQSNRKEFEPSFEKYIDALNPTDKFSVFLDRFADFCDDWKKAGKWAPRLPMLNVVAREFGYGNFRFMCVHSAHYELVEQLHNELNFRLAGRHDGYRFWLWVKYQDRLARKEAALLESFGKNEVVATNFGDLLAAAPVVDKGDRRRKHEDRKQPRTGRNGKRWSGKGGFEIEDRDDDN